MGHLSHPLEHAGQGCVLAELCLAEGIEHERGQATKGDDHIQLHVCGKAKTIGGIPAEHHRQVHADDGKGGADMGIAQLYEQVVQVGLVGAEGRLAPQDTCAHHPERVKDGHAQYGKGEGHKPHSFGHCRRAGFSTQAGGDEHGEDNAQRKRAGIADEHLGRLAIHVMKEERKQRGHHNGGERDHTFVAQMVEHHAEKGTAHNAVARGIAVHAIDEVNRIDDAHTGEHRQWNGHIRRHCVKAPQTMEVADADARGHDKVEHKNDLYDEPYLGGKGYHVVHETNNQDYDDAGKDGEKVIEVAEEIEAHHTRKDAEHHRQSAKYGDWHTLELACVGIVHNVLYLGHLEDIGKDPGGAKKGDKRGEDNLLHNIEL